MAFVIRLQLIHLSLENVEAAKHDNWLVSVTVRCVGKYKMATRAARKGDWAMGAGAGLLKIMGGQSIGLNRN